MGVLAYNLLQMIRQFYVWGEGVKRPLIWLIKRLIKVGARVSHYARRWYLHVASGFPRAQHYRALLAWGAKRWSLLDNYVQNLRKNGFPSETRAFMPPSG
jgi:hypothetical protein